MMFSIRKEIFGKNYAFTCEDRLAEIVKGSVELYPNTQGNRIDVDITLSEIPKEAPIARNPSIFSKYKNGFLTHFPPCQVLWNHDPAENSLAVTLFLSKSRSKAMAAYSRLRSMEYATEVEEFEQILHELVLVPSVYFFPDLSLVHAAAISVNGKALLLAGTGGTGKTSALLALRKDDRAGFLSDDIAVISQGGNVYPNLAWPKIYGYNLSSYIEKKEVLRNRSMLDKLHFNTKLYLNPKTVRRKIRPDRLYASVNFQSIPLDRVVYLIRDNSEKINIRNLLPESAVRMGIHVMKTEYGIFHNHLEWDAYNSLAIGMAPVLQSDQVFKHWENNLTAVFQQVNLQSLHIPIGEKHEDYLNFINDILLDG